jgi:Protein of unknown function (DUF1236)
MTKRLIIGAALAGSLFAIQPTFAQDGYIVGNTVGVVQGAPIVGIAPNVRPQFRTYVVERHIPSYQYQGPVSVGEVLPESGVTYYQVPNEYGASDYRYTIVNDEPVLVDPGSRRIVQVIEPGE